MAENKNRERLIYVSKAAEKLNCSAQHVYNLINDGHLKAVKIGSRSLRIPESSLKAFIEDREVDSQTILI